MAVVAEHTPSGAPKGVVPLKVGKGGPSDPPEGRRRRAERVAGRRDGKDFEPTNRLNSILGTGEG